MINAILSICDENVEHVVHVLKVLYIAMPDINWMNELREAAFLWQPFIDRGLSIENWLNTIDANLD